MSDSILSSSLSAQLHSLVYCRVVRSHRDMEAELSCISPHIKAEWVTGQTFFGPLTAGVCTSVSLSTARRLLTAAAGGVLELCGSHVSYEVAVGMNGRVWIQCANPLAAVLIINAIANSAHMSQQQTADMVRQLFASLS
jgi:exosome complex component RRP40